MDLFDNGVLIFLATEFGAFWQRILGSFGNGVWVFLTKDLGIFGNGVCGFLVVVFGTF